LTPKQRIDPSIQEYIISIVKEEHPETVNQLIKCIQQKYPITEHETIRLLEQLQSQGKIRFRKEETRPLKLSEFVFSSNALWYWITITLAIATTITVFTVPEESYPLVYIRYILGSAFVLWLPGYTLVKALFPSKKTLDTIEAIALSIGLSLAIVPIVGLLLNYTPWGIRLTPITLSLLALTVTFATSAIIREYQTATRTIEPGT
jgi:uncharacterized membrane protein